LQSAIGSVQNNDAVTAIREATFGTPGNVNDTCTVDDTTSLDGLVDALTSHYPIASVLRNFDGAPLLPARQRESVCDIHALS